MSNDYFSAGIAAADKAKDFNSFVQTMYQGQLMEKMASDMARLQEVRTRLSDPASPLYQAIRGHMGTDAPVIAEMFAGMNHPSGIEQLMPKVQNVEGILYNTSPLSAPVAMGGVAKVSADQNMKVFGNRTPLFTAQAPNVVIDPKTNQPAIDENGRPVMEYARPDQPLTFTGQQKDREVDKALEVAFLGAYPDYMSNSKTRNEAHLRFAKDPDFRQQIMTTAQNYASGKYPITYSHVGQTTGGRGQVLIPNRPNQQGIITPQVIDVPQGVVPKAGDMPTNMIENFQGAIASWKNLDKMDNFVKSQANVPVVGLVRKGAGWAGMDKTAQEFQAAWNNMRLSAQSMVKGIPSNYDIETVLATLPNFSESGSMNREKMQQARDTVKNLTESVLSYYMGSGHYIPPLYVKQAKNMGIDVNNIRPWNGDIDPFEKLVNPSAEIKTAPVAPNSKNKGMDKTYPMDWTSGQISQDLQAEGIDKTTADILALKYIKERMRTKREGDADQKPYIIKRIR